MYLNDDGKTHKHTTKERIKTMAKLNSNQIEKLWCQKDVFGKLIDRYTKKLNEKVDIESLEFEEVESIEGDTYESCYVGSVMSIFPSGKYYMPWTSNQTIKDEMIDNCFVEALEAYLDKYNMWWENGEGDPTDVFICRQVTK